MNDDLHTQSPLIFISLKNTKNCQKKKVDCLSLVFTDLLVSCSHKRPINDGEPRKLWELYARGSLIRLSYLNLVLLKGILTTANRGPSDFVASQ